MFHTRISGIWIRASWSLGVGSRRPELQIDLDLEQTALPWIAPIRILRMRTSDIRGLRFSAARGRDRSPRCSWPQTLSIADLPTGCLVFRSCGSDSRLTEIHGRMLSLQTLKTYSFMRLVASCACAAWRVLRQSLRHVRCSRMGTEVVHNPAWA